MFFSLDVLIDIYHEEKKYMNLYAIKESVTHTCSQVVQTQQMRSHRRVCSDSQGPGLSLQLMLDLVSET